MKKFNRNLARACGWDVRQVGTAWAWFRHGQKGWQGGYLTRSEAWKAVEASITPEQVEYVTKETKA